MRLIILAAGQGARLKPITDSRPKCLVELCGKSLLEHQIDSARKVGIDDIVVVGGYLHQQLRCEGIRLLLNPDYERTNMVYTLFCAEDVFGDEFILSYGDIVYSKPVFETLLADKSDIGVVIDRQWREYWSLRFDDILSDAESLKIDNEGNIVNIGEKVTSIDSIEAQYIGLMAFRGDGIKALHNTYSLAKSGKLKDRLFYKSIKDFNNMYMTDLLQGIIDSNFPVKAIPVKGQWIEIDTFKDLRIAERLLLEGRLTLQ